MTSGGHGHRSRKAIQVPVRLGGARPLSAPHRSIAVSLEPALTSVAVARRHVAELFRGVELPELYDAALLVTSELVANAVVHGDGPPRLRLTLWSTVCHVEVEDDDPRPLRAPTLAPEGGDGGRGLYLVDQLAAEWGSRPEGRGKVVWCRLEHDRDGLRSDHEGGRN